MYLLLHILDHRDRPEEGDGGGVLPPLPSYHLQFFSVQELLHLGWVTPFLAIISS